MSRKESLAKELLSHEEELAESFYGGIVLRNCNIANYRKKQSSWKSGQLHEERKRELFRDIMSDDVVAAADDVIPDDVTAREPKEAGGGESSGVEEKYRKLQLIPDDATTADVIQTDDVTVGRADSSESASTKDSKKHRKKSKRATSRTSPRGREEIDGAELSRVKGKKRKLRLLEVRLISL